MACDWQNVRSAARERWGRRTGLWTPAVVCIAKRVLLVPGTAAGQNMPSGRGNEKGRGSNEGSCSSRELEWGYG